MARKGVGEQNLYEVVGSSDRSSDRSSDHVIYIKQGRESSWRRKALGVAGIGVASIAMANFVESKFHIPNLLGFLDRSGKAAQDAAANAIHASKSTADRIVGEINPRTVKPIEVDPEAVVKGAITGKVAFGESERDYKVLKSKMEYDGWLPGTDEWIGLDEGEWKATARVPGPLSFEVKGKTIQIVLPEATVQPAAVIKVPHDTNDRQPGAAVGQALGSSTSRAKADQELIDYVNGQVAKDYELKNAATCWAKESVQQVINIAIVKAGLELLDPADPSGGGYSTDVITYFAADGQMGPPAPMTDEFCKQLIDKTTAYNSGLQLVPVSTSETTAYNSSSTSVPPTEGSVLTLPPITYPMITLPKQ